MLKLEQPVGIFDCLYGDLEVEDQLPAVRRVAAAVSSFSRTCQLTRAQPVAESRHGCPARSPVLPKPCTEAYFHTVVVSVLRLSAYQAALQDVRNMGLWLVSETVTACECADCQQRG